MRALCRYLRDASSHYACHSNSPRDSNRARLLSNLYHKLSMRLFRAQCANIKKLLNDIQS